MKSVCLNVSCSNISQLSVFPATAVFPHYLTSSQYCSHTAASIYCKHVRRSIWLGLECIVSLLFVCSYAIIPASHCSTKGHCSLSSVAAVAIKRATPARHATRRLRFTSVARIERRPLTRVPRVDQWLESIIIKLTRTARQRAYQGRCMRQIPFRPGCS